MSPIDTNPFVAAARRVEERTLAAVAESGLTREQFMEREAEREREYEQRQRVNAFLAEDNYPQRARAAVERMQGPGFAKAQELLPLVESGDCILILTGDRGTGKTQMATWLAYQQVRAGKSGGRYVKTMDLLAEIKATWGSKNAESSVLNRYKATKFLVLDEFQERSGEEWDSRLLINLVDHRYDNMLVTILIANLAENEIPARIPASIISRAEQTGGLVACGWKSYRQ